MALMGGLGPRLALLLGRMLLGGKPKNWDDDCGIVGPTGVPGRDSRRTGRRNLRGSHPRSVEILVLSVCS